MLEKIEETLEFIWRKTGYRTKIANSYIQISSCFVLATDNETFGMAIMDAMRCGTCVLGSEAVS